jgi:hypothetical protein
VLGEMLDEVVLSPAEGITHCEDAPPAEGPNVEDEELPKPSCAGAAATVPFWSRTRAAALTFLPVRPMPPLSRGIKEQLQADRQHLTQQVRQSVQSTVALGRNPAHGHAHGSWESEGLGTDRRRALVSCSGTPAVI